MIHRLFYIFWIFEIVFLFSESFVINENDIHEKENVMPLPAGDMKYELVITTSLANVLEVRRTKLSSSYRNIQWTLSRGTPQSGDQPESESDTSLYLAFHLDSLPERVSHFYGTVNCQLRTANGDYYSGNSPHEIGVKENFSYRVEPIYFTKGMVNKLRLTCAVEGVLRSHYVTEQVVKSMGSQRPVPLSNREVSFMLSQTMQIQFDAQCAVDAGQTTRCSSNYRPMMGVEIYSEVMKSQKPIFALDTRFTFYRGNILYANCELNNRDGTIMSRESRMWESENSVNSDSELLVFPQLLESRGYSNTQNRMIDVRCYVEYLINFKAI